MHHPIYPFDDHHSESPAMADVLQHAINDSPRIPNLVLTGHVHNYQRIEKEILKGKPTPFVVAGNGGYFNLHRLTAKNGTTDQFTGAHASFWRRCPSWLCDTGCRSKKYFRKVCVIQG